MLAFRAIRMHACRTQVKPELVTSRIAIDAALTAVLFAVRLISGFGLSGAGLCLLNVAEQGKVDTGTASGSMVTEIPGRIRPVLGAFVIGNKKPVFLITEHKNMLAAMPRMPRIRATVELHL